MVGFLLLGCNIAAFNYISFVLASKPYQLHDTIISFIYLLFLIGMLSSILNAKLRRALGTLNALKFSILLLIVGIWITLLPPLPFKILGLAFSVYAFLAVMLLPVQSLQVEQNIIKLKPLVYTCCFIILVLQLVVL